jgi:DNA-binding PadR family transcriptional regulator
MAKRRAVGNLLALAVLGTLVTKPMHPYEIASVMRSRGKEGDLPVRWGSLYRVVQNLAKHGYVHPVQSERLGGRPERTVYGITDAGRAELVDWVRELIASPEQGVTGFTAGLSLLGALTPDDVAEALTRRVDALTRQIADGRAQVEHLSAELPPLFLVESEYGLAVLAADLRWARDLLAQITEGRMPGLEQWRAFTTTGAMSPELTALAERGTDPAS